MLGVRRKSLNLLFKKIGAMPTKENPRKNKNIKTKEVRALKAKIKCSTIH